MADATIAYTNTATDVYAPTDGGGAARGAVMGEAQTLHAEMAGYLGQAFGMFGSKTYDPGSLADGAGETTTVTVTGAALGDFALASFSLDLQGIILSAWVSAADTVSVRFQNESGDTLDLASGTLRAWVRVHP